MQTENMCGNGENDWKALENSWEMVVHYFNNGAGSYMYWNMVLENRGMSSWGWPQNSLVSIDCEKKSFRLNDEFYLMKHLSRFVQPGSRMLTLEGDDKNALAFRTAEKGVALVIYNPEVTEKQKSVGVDGKIIRLTLAPKSINTLLLPSVP
jgi:glucosylceramidase